MMSRPLTNTERNYAVFVKTDHHGNSHKLVVTQWTINQVEPYGYAIDNCMADGKPRHYYLSIKSAKNVRKTMRRAYRDANLESPV